MGIFDVFRRRAWSRDEFAARVIQRARSLVQATSANYDADSFQIQFELPGGRPFTMMLHNAFTDTGKVARGERDRVIDKYVLALTETQSDTPGDLATHLMPVIRDAGMFSWASLSARLTSDAGPAKLPWSTPFSGDLSITLVQDLEHATRTVNPTALSDAGLDEESAFTRALANLRDRTQDGGMERHGGVWVSTWHDVYDASRILLTDMIHRLPVHGVPVAMIPSRDHLLVTGSLDDDGIALIASLAADILENDTRPMSPQLFILREGTWTPFEAPLPPDIKRRLTLARYKRLDGMYGDQKTLLEKIHDKEQVDVFVATYRAAQNTETGRITGSAQWTRDVRTLLPECDLLWLLCRQRNELLEIEWADALPHVPELRQPHGDLVPPRYLLTQFPDDATYALLREKATYVKAVSPG
ncbi:hypothetical protein [Luteibacter aegosomatissinici]|uniref:hypothetical protein n=1 Tax=Luteibacter aegosomatissinici TaxID=2911539 RepID=UPI001FFB04AE|nr:hypothetical protein [Luteibacter aegosomatissinici]UPG96537.1 hypothetical protein L2Y97_10600 [Luteibacter aegosomatissinici]